MVNEKKKGKKLKKFLEIGGIITAVATTVGLTYLAVNDGARKRVLEGARKIFTKNTENPTAEIPVEVKVVPQEMPKAEPVKTYNNHNGNYHKNWNTRREKQQYNS